jgi:AraC-like DNA-binding protein
MMPSFNFVSVIICIGLVQGIFLAFLLWTHKRDNQLPSRILAVFIVAFALSTVHDVLAETHFYISAPNLLFVFDPIVLIIAPLLWLYVVALTTPNFRFDKRLWLNGIPAGLCWLVGIPLFLASPELKLKMAFPEHYGQIDLQELSLTNISIGAFGLLVYLSIVQILVYWIFCMRRLQWHARQILQTHSSLEKAALQWLQWLLWAAFASWGVFAATFLTKNEWVQTLNAIDFSIVIFAFGYAGLKQPDIFTGFRESSIPLTEPVAIAAETEKLPKYEKSTLPDDKVAALLKSLQRIMQTDKPHLNPNLTLQDLADKLDTTTHHLSQLLNNRLNQNFFDFVNGYRVGEVKKDLLNPRKKNLTIMALAYDAGFNSKAAFNAAFKKHTTQTPSEFRKTAQTDLLTTTETEKN